MNIEVLFQSITLLSITKFLMVSLLSVYAVFALLMARQVSAMTKAVHMKDDYVIQILAVLNLGFAILVLVMSVLIL